MKKVIVFGATGSVGKEVVNEAGMIFLWKSRS